MTFGGAGNILVHAPDSGVALTVEGGGANIVGSLDATLDVTARTLFADGDEGTGVASTTAITNVVDTTLSSGDLSIKATSANPGNNAGFIKAYVGTQVVYIPYFTTIAP